MSHLSFSVVSCGSVDTTVISLVSTAAAALHPHQCMPFARTASPASADAGARRPFHVCDFKLSADSRAVRPDMCWTCKVGRQHQQNRQQRWSVSRIGPPGSCVPSAACSAALRVAWLKKVCALEQCACITAYVFVFQRSEYVLM